jgi:hypothetical protein
LTFGELLSVRSAMTAGGGFVVRRLHFSGRSRDEPLVAGPRAWVKFGPPTRLETRTKESTMRASHWVMLNLKAQ